MLTKLLKSLLGDSYSEQNAQVVVRNLGISLLMFIIAAIMLLFLPSRIPMQWKADGSVSYTLPSVVGVWTFPGVSLLVNLNWLRKDNFQKNTTIILALIALAMCAFFGYILATR